MDIVAREGRERRRAEQAAPAHGHGYCRRPACGLSGLPLAVMPLALAVRLQVQLEVAPRNLKRCAAAAPHAHLQNGKVFSSRPPESISLIERPETLTARATRCR